MMKKLNNDNIIKFYDNFVDNTDGMYMFIELC